MRFQDAKCYKNMRWCKYASDIRLTKKMFSIFSLWYYQSKPWWYLIFDYFMRTHDMCVSPKANGSLASRSWDWSRMPGSQIVFFHIDIRSPSRFGDPSFREPVTMTKLYPYLHWKASESIMDGTLSKHCQTTQILRECPPRKPQISRSSSHWSEGFTQHMRSPIWDILQGILHSF